MRFTNAADAATTGAGRADSTAVFVGAVSVSGPIDHATFSESVGFPGFPRESDPAITQLSMLIAIPEASEPSTALLFAPALLSFAARRR